MPYDPSSLMRRIVAPIPVPWGRAKYPFAALPAILTFVAMVLLLVVSCRREASTALFMVDISENTDPNTWVKFWSREFYNGKDTVTVRPWTIPTYNDTAVNTSLTRSLLKTMVLHPIGGVSSLLVLNQNINHTTAQLVFQLQCPLSLRAPHRSLDSLG
ncbi:hypothetical protein DL96DRAFT_1589583 [Flagelloscypha sp. PMI_526]|nr:hypothetical protein DL96DRAFT_1589583 [Flagelloscypha sp. PMI_526]